MGACPACARPAAAGRARCLYCGAPLPEAEAAPAEAPAPPPPGPEGRDRVVCDAAGVEPAALGAALGIGAYEAGQVARRGGWQELRALPAAEALGLAERLRAAGARAEVVPEAESRRAARPLPVQGGGFEAGTLALDTASGPLSLAPAALLLIVRGPIAREYQAQEASGWRALRQVRVHNPQPGYRIHLHRRADPVPLELDPAEFAFRTPRASALLELGAWCDALARDGVAVDDAFRKLPVALALVAAREEEAQGARPGTPRGEKEGDRLLDNLVQFRAYSAWRGALERRLGAR
jgi:hypothetical protein